MSGADDLTPTSVGVCIAQAELDGFTVVKGNSTTLLLDLDTDAACEQFSRVLPTVLQYFDVIGREEWKSKSGNRHVKLTLGTELAPYARYALQAALGSDGVKEALTCIRYQYGCEDDSCLLFKPKPTPTPKKLVRRSTTQ